MKLWFTPRATLDLIDIADGISARNPAGAVAVRAAILASIQTILTFPEIGRRQTVEGVRKLVTRRYGYLIYYKTDHEIDELTILTIQHPARRRAFSDA